MRETKSATVSSETIWNEVQVARTAGWVFHPIFLATSTFSPNAKGADIGRTLPSLSEELNNGSDVVRVTFWQTAGLPPRENLGDTFRVF